VDTHITIRGDRLTEKELNEYQAIKREIADLNRRIQETKEGPVMSFGTVKGSSKYFPYTPMNFHVSGIDPADTDIRQEQITELLRQREVQRDELLKKQIEIEQYVSGIKDSTTRIIFRMYYLDGMTQEQISRKINLDRSVISRRINKTIKRL
jgi:RNA polymerase sigma factor (sigma-70 family)